MEVSIKYPTSFADWTCIFIDHIAGINEIAAVGKGFEFLRDGLLKNFIPDKILQSIENTDGIAFPLLSNKTAIQQPLIYLCRNYTCQLPHTNVETTIDELKKH